MHTRIAISREKELSTDGQKEGMMTQKPAHESLRQEQLSLLLQLSKEFATVNDRDQLWQVITEKLGPMIGFAESVVFVRSADGQRYQLLLSAPSPAIRQHPIYKEHPEKPRTLPGSPMEYLFRREGVFEFSCLELLERFPGHPGLRLMKDIGLIYSVAVSLRSGGQFLGQLFFHFREASPAVEKECWLYEAVGEQISTVVANIMAREEIIEKNMEIEKLNQLLREQNAYLVEEIKEQRHYKEIIGKNAALKEVCRRMDLVAGTDTTILILGETGTGKELIARAIHDHSPRAAKPLIRVNCATLPANLIESELFGHERGAFTGAFDRRIGKFELAHGSTLFLDEIGELSPELQAKLLRALQEKEIERLGSNRVIRVDTRIIAATNRDLDADIQKGKFRADLFYRLNVFPLLLPPLRERKDDLPFLINHFIDRLARKHGKQIKGVTPKAMQELLLYSWPGNVRELEHTIERTVLLAKGKYLETFTLPLPYHRQDGFAEVPVIKPLQEHERDYILSVLEKCSGRIRGSSGAAKLLGIPPTTLESKMKKLGIRREFRTDPGGANDG